MTKKKGLKNESNQKQKSFEAALVLCNDDVNSFDYIIEQLQEIVNHNEHQATQCTFTAHFKGTAVIEKGTQEYLMNLKKQFSLKSITTLIESIE